MNKTRLCVMISALVLSTLAFAQDSVKPDDAIEYRQGLMTVIGWNFGPLGAMVKGKRSFDATEFARHAERIAAISDSVIEGFPKGSDKGSSERTAAKADIWNHWDDFQAKANDFHTQARLLADIAKANDEAKNKEQFKKVAETCKACHDKYKQKM
ncbi:MAG: cytochrome c [Proteobacteria bacterium]|nr:cytochrome c [Pseudomonadota bacterium]